MPVQWCLIDSMLVLLFCVGIAGKHSDVSFAALGVQAYVRLI